MKKLKFIRFMMVLATGLLFVNCTSDPIQGPTGISGTDGIDGVNGVNGTASCVSCHSNSHREPIQNSFSTSLHATGTAWARGSSVSCAQCHGNEGFIDYVTKGAVNPDGYAGVVSPMSCTTCHDKHSSFDFENDGYDYALRTRFDPVKLVIDPTVTIDFGGTSNNCAVCHQPRNSYPVPGGTEDITINNRYGPHYGPQSTMLEGIMGANIAGSVAYPAVGTAAHRTGSSCVSCHMGQTTDGSDGSHTWNPTINTCITCHSSGAPEAVAGYAADFASLHDLLLNAGAITETGSPVAGTFPVKIVQAVWNYKTLAEDKSDGVHNPAYSKALLKNSIEALQQQQ